MESIVNKSELIDYRNHLTDDRNFILATFLRGLYYGDSWFSEINKSVFMEHYHKVINYLIDKKTINIRVACLKDDPTVILGYAIFEGDTLHWVFIKKSWRNIGLAKDLVPKDIKIVTHLTSVGLSISKRKGFEFNPFKL